ncbi:MAG: hypothetical protein RLZZ387_4173 [Chloroflexota bacterium]|jgi:hypothetical protein
MPTRRTFLRASAAALIASAAGALARAQSGEETFAPVVYLPTVDKPLLPTATPTAEPTATPEPTAVPAATPSNSVCTTSPPPSPDAPIVAPASGTVELALAWLAPRADASYSDDDLRSIVEAYRSVGDRVGVDWFMAIAQMVHETGSMTSWWSQRPRRNPAGIAVTGRTSSNPIDTPPGLHWAWDDRSSIWREGVSFADWTQDAVPAHLGRLLAYALTNAEANDAQREVIAKALSYRSLVTYRGAAKTWQGLNSKWAYPGCTYGQSIISLARRMGGAPTVAGFEPALLPADEDGDWMPPEG